MAEVKSSDSILESVKKDIGASEWDDAFDDQLIRHINTTFQILNQLGVGVEGYKIDSRENTWDEFVTEDYEATKSLVSKRVKMMFDTPTSSFAAEADKEIIAELEWRLNIAVDPG